MTRLYGRDYVMVGRGWRPGSDPGRPTRDEHGAAAELERVLLEGSMRRAQRDGLTNPLPPAVPGHGPVLIEHSHDHHHNGADGDSDTNHSHLHTHHGDADHDHHTVADVLGDGSGVPAAGVDSYDMLAWTLAGAIEKDWRPGRVRDSALGSDDPEKFLAGICAGLGSGGAEDLGRWSLPHHESPDDAPVPAAVRLGLAALRSGDYPAGTDVAAAYRHLEHHARQAKPCYPGESSGAALAAARRGFAD